MGAAKTARGRSSTRPNNLGLVFEHFAGSDGATWNLDRPFDLAPKGDTSYTVADLAQGAATATCSTSRLRTGLGRLVRAPRAGSCRSVAARRVSD